MKPFIDKIDTIWHGTQQTLSTGGQCINYLHQMVLEIGFIELEKDLRAGTNKFNFIKLHWTVHPDRDESWRREQDGLLDPSFATRV